MAQAVHRPGDVACERLNTFGVGIDSENGVAEIRERVGQRRAEAPEPDQEHLLAGFVAPAPNQ